jgi:hypothetical protein
VLEAGIGVVAVVAGVVVGVVIGVVVGVGVVTGVVVGVGVVTGVVVGVTPVFGSPVTGSKFPAMVEYPAFTCAEVKPFGLELPVELLVEPLELPVEVPPLEIAAGFGIPPGKTLIGLLLYVIVAIIKRVYRLSFSTLPHFRAK